MANLEFKDYVIAFMLSILFFYCMYFGFAAGLQTYYGIHGANTSFQNMTAGTRTSLNDMNEQLDAANDTATLWKETYTTDDAKDSTLVLFLKSIWGVVKGMFTSTFTIATLIFTVSHDVLGIPLLVIGVIIFIIIILLIFASYKVIKTGGWF